MFDLDRQAELMRSLLQRAREQALAQGVHASSHVNDAVGTDPDLTQIV